MVFDLKFIRSINPTFEFNWHHNVQCQNINSWLEGNIKNLMVLAPPRSGKTELHSRILMCYLADTIPENKKVLHISYSESIANDLKRSFRRSMGNHLYQNIVFSYVGCSLSSQFDYIIMDDLVRSYADALNPKCQQMVCDWYKNDLLTRLPHGGKQLMVASHYPNDLPSKIINSHNSSWGVTKFPLVAEHSNIHRKEGDILWTKLMPSIGIDNMKNSFGNVSYTTIWQQEDPKEEMIIISY